MKKSELYQVRCTPAVKREMTRYEGSMVIVCQNPECDKRWLGDEEMMEAYTTYEYIIRGNPVVGRWKSFGVTVIQQ